MKTIFSSLIVAACVLPCVQGAGSQDKKQGKLNPEEQKIFELINEERTKNMLPALKTSPQLTEVARAHAANMARQGKMDHNLDGKTPYDRIKGAGYKYSLAGENLAVGEVPQEDVVKAWMKSKVHRENILDNEFTETGLGAVRDDKGKVWYVQVFANPRK